MLRGLTALAGSAALALVAAAAPAAAQGEGGTTDATYQDWKVQCKDTGECLALHESEGVYVAVREEPSDGTMRVSFIVRPQAGEGAPIGLRLDSGWSAQLQVVGCKENFCEAPVDPGKAQILVDRFKKEVGGVVAYPAAGKVAISAISLLGFTDALQHAQR